MRRAIRIVAALLVLGGIGVLAVLGTAIAISQGWQRERLRSLVETRLAEALEDEVAVGGIQGPLLPYLIVDDLRIGPAQDPTVRVARLRIGIGWRRTLASRTLVLRRLDVQGAALSLHRDERGDWGLPEWLAGDEDEAPDGAPPSIQVDRTRIEDARIRVAWQEQGEPAALRIEASAQLPTWRLPMGPEDAWRATFEARAVGEGAAARWLDNAFLEAELDGPTLSLQTLAMTGGETPPLRLVAPATLRLEEDRVTVDELALESERQRLVVRGAVSRDGFHQLHAELRDLDVTLAGRLLGGTARPGGRLSGQIVLDGAFARPEGRVDLAWSEPSLGDLTAERATLRASGDGREILVATLSVEGLPGGPLQLGRPARIRVREDAIDLSGIELRNAHQALVANGTIARDRFDDLEIELRELDVGWLGRVLELPGQPAGTLAGSARLDGPFARPSGTLALQWSEPRWNGLAGERIVVDASADRELVRARASWLRNGQRLDLDVQVPPQQLERALAAGSPTRTRGALPADAVAHLTSDAFALDAAGAWLPEPGERLEGDLRADLTLRGGDPPSLEGSLSVADARLRMPGRDPLPGLRAELTLDGDPGALHVERFELEGPGFALEARGRWARDGASHLEIDAGSQDLEQLARVLSLDAPLEGTLEVSLALDGRWPRPDLAGDAVWTHAAPDALTPHRAELTLRSEERRLRGDLAIHQGGRVAARGDLLVPYGDDGLPALQDAATREGRLELAAQDFDLATLSPLLPRLVRDLRGRADADLVVEAGAEQPSIRGELSITGGSIRVPAARQTFGPIEGTLLLRDRVVRIDELRVGEPGRHADLTGQIALSDALAPARVDLAMQIEKLPLARARPLTTDASGRLQLTGPVDALELEGAVELSDARVRLVEVGDPTLREIEVVTSDAERRGRLAMQEQPPTPDSYERARIDVELIVPRNTWVRGRGADIDLAGTLRLEKEPGEPARVTGRVATLRGTYRFQGKRFDLRRGSVSFAGTADLDPSIDIEAVHRVRDVSIVILLSGTASEPVITLTSEPPLAEEDVLSYLFFGRPTDELGSRQPAAALDRAAAAFAAGVALRQASRLVEDSMPIDTVDVRIEEDGSSGGLGVGKYLTDDLFVRYERGFGKDAVDGVKVELRLTEHWSVETEASTDESAGADLVWSFDY